MDAADGDDGSEDLVVERGRIEDLVEQTELASAKAVKALARAEKAIADAKPKDLEGAYAMAQEAYSECTGQSHELVDVAGVLMMDESRKSELRNHILNASAVANANKNLAYALRECIGAFRDRNKLKWPS